MKCACGKKIDLIELTCEPVGAVIVKNTRKIYAICSSCARSANISRPVRATRIGKIDTCAECGKQYYVRSQLQKFCPVCKPKKAQEVAERANTKRKERRNVKRYVMQS
jgi:hypothetical protein